MSTVTCEVEPLYAATAGAEKDLGGGKVEIPHEQRRLVFPVAGNGKGRRLDGGGRRGGGSSFSMNRYDNNLLLRGRASAGDGRMQVFVRTPTGKTLALDVYPSDTVDVVKAKIESRERVAAGEPWRLVFAGRHLDDGARTLADYGVGTEANLHILLRLRGGAGAGDDTVGPQYRRSHTIGLLATVFAVAAALSCFPAAAGSSGLGTAVLLLFLLAGVNLITAGLCLSSTAAATGILFGATRAMLKKTSSFVRRNVAVVAVSAASFAVTGAFDVNAARPALGFGFFVLFLFAVSLVTIVLAN